MRRRLLSTLTVLAVTSGLMLATGTAADAAVVRTTSNGVTYEADDAAPAAGATVVSVDGGTAPKALVLPTTVQIGGATYTVTSIAPGAAEIQDLTSITLPGRLVTIGDSAFLGNDLTTLSLPSTVTSIGNGAFTGNALTSVSLSSSLLSIGEGAFAGNQLTTVAFPALLKVIDSGAFVSNRIGTIAVPASVSVIDDAAFADNPLTAAVFAGPPPTTFSPATPPGGSPIGSLGAGTGLTVSYPAQFAAPGYAGGFTSPIWQGYAAKAVAGTPPTPPTTPPTGTTPAKPTITKVRAHRRAGALVVFKVTVANLGDAAVQGLRVKIKNRPRAVTYPKRTDVVGALAGRATVTVKLKARVRSGARPTFVFKALSDNAPRSTFKVRLPGR